MTTNNTVSVVKYYVYCYLDPEKNGLYRYDDVMFDNEPFYIGKGSGKRAYKLNGHKKILKECSTKTPIIKILYGGLDEYNALKLENTLIKKIGRLCTETGPLLNKVVSSVQPYVFTDEIKEKMSLRMIGNKNTNAKTYEISDIYGMSYKIDCLKSFCIDNNLVYTTVHSAIKQKRWHKGFFIKPLYDVSYYTYEVNNPRPLYEVTDINGNKRIIDNLSSFIKEIGLPSSTVRRLIKQEKNINGLMLRYVKNDEKIKIMEEM